MNGILVNYASKLFSVDALLTLPVDQSSVQKPPVTGVPVKDFKSSLRGLLILTDIPVSSRCSAVLPVVGWPKPPT